MNSPELKLRPRLKLKQGLLCWIEENFGVPCDVALRKTHDAIGSDVRTKRFDNSAIASLESLTVGCLDEKSILMADAKITRALFIIPLSIGLPRLAALGA